MKIGEFELNDDSLFVGLRSYHSVLEPQKRAYNAHHHTQCEISVFLSGKGTYAMHQKSYDFAAGDVFLFGSNEEHCITEITERIDLLNIQFEPYLLWEKSDTAEILALFNARNESFENRFQDTGEEIRDKLLQIEAELSEKRICYAVAVRYLLFMTLTTLVRKYPCIDRNKTMRASDGTAQRLRLVIEYVQENLENKLTLEGLAGVACLSPTYLSYMFKKLNGISLWEYISIKRVERAKEMLKSESMTKLEIAERCGFSSSSNFYKAFYAVTGKRPGDYAKKNE